MEGKLINTFKQWVCYYKTSAVPFTEYKENANISSSIQCNTDPSTEPNNLCLTEAYLPENKPIFYQKHQVLANPSLPWCLIISPGHLFWTMILRNNIQD